MFVLEWNCLCLHADRSDRISQNGQLIAINNVTNKNKINVKSLSVIRFEDAMCNKSVLTHIGIDVPLTLLYSPLLSCSLSSSSMFFKRPPWKEHCTVYWCINQATIDHNTKQQSCSF